MNSNEQALNAPISADLAVSQAEPAPGAALGIDETHAASRTDQPPVKKTVAALDRNIEGCDRLLERYPQKLAKARLRKEATEVVALEKEKENLIARKEILQRLRAQEMRTS